MRNGLFAAAFGVAVSMGVLSNYACGGCPVGSEGCQCTDGNACDAGLSCLSDLCVNENSMGMDGFATMSTSAGSEDGADTTASSTDATSNTDTSDSTTGATTTGTTTTNGDGGGCNVVGCKKVDLLFAIDSSNSMIEEVQALSAVQTFSQVVNSLVNLNCGDIDFRIGLTNDYIPSFITPTAWTETVPWFDSTTMSTTDIQTGFTSAAGGILSGGTPIGCEHVLSNASAVLVGDTTGFLRPDALLVLVLITDVDDYGAYDQQGGNSCGLGCTQTPQPVADLYNNLLTLKGGDAAAISTIVVAGDPTANAGMNICGQPQSCGAPVSAFHASRLYDFAGMLMDNGATADICAGAGTVPTAIDDALNDRIDLACQTYEPED
jgi:hypothetical protein